MTRAAAFVVLITSACASAPTTPPCVQPLSPTLDRSRLGMLPNQYRLTLVSQTGPQQGQAITGDLELQANPDTLRTVTDLRGAPVSGTTAPYYGWVSFAGSVAPIPGDPGARDPDAPGVLVLNSATGVMLRIGSIANNRRETPIEGNYFVMRIRDLGPDGFRGTWTAGSSAGRETARGFFCALLD